MRLGCSSLTLPVNHLNHSKNRLARLCHVFKLNLEGAPAWHFGGEMTQNGAGSGTTKKGDELKIVIVGDGGCGKTSLLMVYAKGDFPEVRRAPVSLFTHHSFLNLWTQFWCVTVTCHTQHCKLPFQRLTRHTSETLQIGINEGIYKHDTVS